MLVSRKLLTRLWDGDLAGEALAGNATAIAKATWLLLEVKTKALGTREKRKKSAATAIA